ncbi:MAG: S24 family peptidase [Thermomicrobiales bacterium]|jgi:DNA polymerase V|nr:MAG: S24 family peptidase [Thermomicrobiales bacterium]
MTSRTIPVHPVDTDSLPACGNGEPFALMVLGDSMAPEFVDGDIVVVEPDGLVFHGAFVIAGLEQDWLLRRLEQFGDKWTLAPLNSKYDSVPIESLDSVKGVVIQRTHARQRGRRKRYLD